MVNSIRRLSLLIILPLLAGGCWSGFYNEPKNDLSLTLERRIPNSNPQTESFVEATAIVEGGNPILRRPTTAATNSGPDVVDADGYFVGLAISGGGSRSANFAAACMLQLQREGILQKVDCISAVSGGTLTATYYCARSDSDWNPKTLQEKLTHSFASNSIIDALLPWNLFAIAFGAQSRSDLLATHFASTLFTRDGRELTFGDLRRDRPRLLINCTDLETGQRFTFDNNNFNQINSNLDRYPLADAVAASSAVPVLMDPVALRDFSTSMHQYYHLVDGGVCDNLGVQSLVESYEAQIQKPVNPYPHGAILIVIDAGIPVSTKMASKAILGGVQNLLSGLDLSSTVLVNRASSATLSEVVVNHSQANYTAAELRGMIRQLQTDHYIEIKDRKSNPVRVVHLSLGQVGELTSISFGSSINRISTGFDISQDETYALYKAADVLFRNRFDAKLTPLLAEIQGAKPSAR
jgi:predicted acylesterase/phospholipase RssA